jgi:hypothetical protein
MEEHFVLLAFDTHLRARRGGEVSRPDLLDLAVGDLHHLPHGRQHKPASAQPVALISRELPAQLDGPVRRILEHAQDRVAFRVVERRDHDVGVDAPSEPLREFDRLGGCFGGEGRDETTRVGRCDGQPNRRIMSTSVFPTRTYVRLFLQMAALPSGAAYPEGSRSLGDPSSEPPAGGSVEGTPRASPLFRLGEIRIVREVRSRGYGLHPDRGV